MADCSAADGRIARGVPDFHVQAAQFGGLLALSSGHVSRVKWSVRKNPCCWTFVWVGGWLAGTHGPWQSNSRTWAEPSHIGAASRDSLVSGRVRLAGRPKSPFSRDKTNRRLRCGGEMAC